MSAFEIFMDPECKAIKEFLSLPNDNTGTAKLAFLIHQQFALRIIFYEPTLFMKSLEKVSLKDLTSAMISPSKMRSGSSTCGSK